MLPDINVVDPDDGDVFLHRHLLDIGKRIVREHVLQRFLVILCAFRQLVVHSVPLRFGYFRLWKVNKDQIVDIFLPVVFDHFFNDRYNTVAGQDRVVQFLRVGEKEYLQRVLTDELPVPVHCFVKIGECLELVEG